MIDKQRLEAKCSTWNIALTGTQLDQLDAFAQILVDYNQKVNLTAITDPEGIEDKHFPRQSALCQPAGSSRAAWWMWVRAQGSRHRDQDLQAGAGTDPDGADWQAGGVLEICLRTAGLTGVEFAKERAEEAARKVWREQFDLASARAVAALPMLAEYCLPLVKVGGSFLAMKGASGEENWRQPGGYQKAGRRIQRDPHPAPAGGDTRTLILCKKISQTPTAYPRNGGKIAKSPLK